MALWANHWLVYAVATFSISTMITNASFLQNLAAILWNRPWAWKESPGTEGQKMAKAANERAEEVMATTTQAGESKRTASSLYHEYSAYEDKVATAFFSAGIFQPSEYRRGVSLAGPQGGRYFLDAVASRENEVFIIEVKLFRNPSSVVQNAVAQVRHYAAIYRQFASFRSGPRKVRGILVVNQPMRNVLPYFDAEVGTLIVNQEGHVENLERFMTWLSTSAT